MSNPVFMSVCLEGDRRELKSLYGKMMRLQERKKPLVDNSFYYPTRWLGNLVTRLGSNWHEVYCRGVWDSLELKKGHLYFITETAWQPPFGLLKLIQKVYPSIEFYFSAEGDDWEAYLTNDKEGKHFTSSFIIDTEPDMEYFDTIEEASTHLSAFIGKPVATTWEALNHAADEWNDHHPDSDWPIIIKKYEIISNNELWD